MILEKAKTLFEAIPDSNPSPKVGALRLYLAALNDLCTWDQMIGLSPRIRSTRRSTTGKFARVLLDGLEAAGIPKETVKEAAQVLITARSAAGLPAGSLSSPQT